MNPAIIIPAFNRPTALERLLSSIKHAHLPPTGIKIVISLDGGYSTEVETLALDFQTHFVKADVEVIVRERNLGLREHLLWCGDQALKHDSVIVLEDDLIVDPYFYAYAQQAAAYYEKNDNIAGIALYAPAYNEFVNLPFCPLYNGKEGYFMQIACSSGQLWTRQQWIRFKTWLEYNDDRSIQETINLPRAIKQWPSTSWKKYFAAYIAQNGLYTFYPYQSYTTNCSDENGTHIRNETNLVQVPLPSISRENTTFEFPEVDFSTSAYDPFMETLDRELYTALGFTPAQVEIDLYGSKPLNLLQKKPYVLTTKRVRSAITNYKLRFKPIEKVYLSPVPPGQGEVFLAKTTEVSADTASRYQLAKYFSGFDLLDRRIALDYIKEFLVKGIRYMSRK